MTLSDDEPVAFFGLIIRAADSAGLAHMVVGSFASGIHGVPRATHDVDLVIEPARRPLSRFLELLSDEDVYVDPRVAQEELQRRGQFNVVDRSSVWKADLIFPKPTPFGSSEFERRSPRTVLGVQTFVATAEDTILAKLVWASLGQSEQQLRDVRGIVEVKANELDIAYIERWLDELGVRNLWERVQA